MESRLKVLGHPVHPMLITFPVGLLATAVIFDIVDAVGGPRLFGEVAYWNILVGLIGALLAAVAGAFDLLAIPAGTRAKRIAITHALVNTSVVLLFIGVWAVRSAADQRGAGGGLLAIEIVALGGLALGAWFGGELVDRLGVGVDPDAGLDAPSSLRTGRNGSPNLVGRRAEPPGVSADGRGGPVPDGHRPASDRTAPHRAAPSRSVYADPAADRELHRQDAIPPDPTRRNQ